MPSEPRPPRPPRLAPMLVGGSGLPAEPDRYQFEPKWDGVRSIVSVLPERVEFTSRNGNDVSAAYPELQALAGHVPSTVFDGEVVAFDQAGRPSFQTLQARMHVRRPAADLVAEVPVLLILFDVLWQDGELLIDRPQSERRAALEAIAPEGPSWKLSPLLDGPADDLLEACRAAGLEGFIGKRLDSPYLPGRRSSAWTKVKCFRQREFVVGGWSEGDGARANDIGSLAIGYVDPDVGGELLEDPVLRYVGQVGSGLSGPLLAQLGPAFARYARDPSPFINTPAHLRLHFVAPLLVVQVQFSEVTRDGTLRQPSLKGLRTDVLPHEVRWDAELE